MPTWMKDAGEAIKSWGAAIAAVVAATLGLLNHGKIQKFQITIDGKMDKLLETTASSAKAEGRREGMEAEQLRMRPPDPAPPTKEKQ